MFLNLYLVVVLYLQGSTGHSMILLGVAPSLVLASGTTAVACTALMLATKVKGKGSKKRQVQSLKAASCKGTSLDQGDR